MIEPTNTTWVPRTFLYKRARHLIARGPQAQLSEYLVIRTTGRVKTDMSLNASESALTFDGDKERARAACFAHDMKLYVKNAELFLRAPNPSDYELVVHDRGWPTITRVECPDHPFTPKDFKP